MSKRAIKILRSIADALRKEYPLGAKEGFAHECGWRYGHCLMELPIETAREIFSILAENPEADLEIVACPECGCLAPMDHLLTRLTVCDCEVAGIEKAMGGQFGSYVRELRLSTGIGLREFCIKVELDPSNWSKVERGVIAPPTDEATLLRICNVLGIQKGSDVWHRLSDKAYADRGIIPTDIMDKDKLLAALPVLFRTAREEKPDQQDLEQLIDLLKRSYE